MTEFYTQLVKSKSDDFSLIPSIIEHYEEQAEEALAQFAYKGQRIVDVSSKLPGLISWRSMQMYELEAILDILQKRLERVRYDRFRYFMEQYDRALTSRDAEKFADGDNDVFAIAMICNQIGVIRDAFKSVVKGLDTLQYQVGHIVKLRENGIEDATL